MVVCQDVAASLVLITKPVPLTFTDLDGFSGATGVSLSLNLATVRIVTGWGGPKNLPTLMACAVW